MIDLNLLRKDKNSWKLVSYSETESEERGCYDQNEKIRYSVLLSIQYDFNEYDEELIRYLFEQEIVARESDDFQGIGNALWLSAFLLAKFNRPRDIPLFYKAKFANFDTACGFDREFMYLALRDKTEDYVLQNHPDLYDEIKGGFSSMDLTANLDDWWNEVSGRYPSKESDELLMDLYERCLYFENFEMAREYLQKWKEVEPESEQKDYTLKHSYKEIGDYSKAIELTKKELETKESNWDKVSCNQDLLKLITQMDANFEGLDVIKTIDEQFKLFSDWKQVGLGRMAVQNAFEYVLASKDLDVAKTAFKYAHSWFKQMNNISFVGLEAGWRAADKCGFSWKARKYKKLADKERRRIDRELDK